MPDSPDLQPEDERALTIAAMGAGAADGLMDGLKDAVEKVSLSSHFESRIATIHALAWGLVYRTVEFADESREPAAREGLALAFERGLALLLSEGSSDGGDQNGSIDETIEVIRQASIELAAYAPSGRPQSYDLCWEWAKMVQDCLTEDRGSPLAMYIYPLAAAVSQRLGEAVRTQPSKKPAGRPQDEAIAIPPLAEDEIAYDAVWPGPMGRRLRHYLIEVVGSRQSADADLLRWVMGDMTLVVFISKVLDRGETTDTPSEIENFAFVDRILQWVCSDGGKIRLRRAVSLYLETAPSLQGRWVSWWATHDAFLFRTVLMLKKSGTSGAGNGLAALHEAISVEIGKPASQLIQLLPRVLAVTVEEPAKVTLESANPATEDSSESQYRVTRLPEDHPIVIQRRALQAASDTLAMQITGYCDGLLPDEVIHRAARTFVAEAFEKEPTAGSGSLTSAAQMAWDAFVADVGSVPDGVRKLVAFLSQRDQEEDEEEELE